MSNPVSVKWFKSSHSGAPSLTGVAGSMIALLDAILVNGYGSVTLSSLTVTSGVATATVNTGHNFEDYVVVLVAGATPAGLNGEKRITKISANAFTFDATGISDGTATGTITAKMAPLGWTKAYSGTNKAVYHPSDANAVPSYLWVDDNNPPTSSNGRWCFWRGFMAMTDIDTGTDPFPTVAQATNGLQILKSTLSDSTARNWFVIGDGRAFYLHTDPQNSTGTYAGEYRWNGYGYGEFVSLVPADGYNLFLSGEIAGQITLPAGAWDYPVLGVTNTVANTNSGKFLPRNYAGISGAVQFGNMVHAIANGSNIGTAGVAFPHPATLDVLISPIAINEANVIRAPAMPGLYGMLHARPLSHYQDVPGLGGRRLLCVGLSNGGGSSSWSQALYDITGPWR